EISNFREDKSDPLWREPKISPLSLYSDNEFRQSYRMSKNVFGKMCSLFGKSLTFVDNRGNPTSPEMQLLIAFRFYATGDFQTVDGDLIGLSQPTISRIVSKVSEVIATKSKEYIKYPSISEFP
ncbi:putative nuclease HARBI1-like protein, partial [Dinothrombium tinctorium]